MKWSESEIQALKAQEAKDLAVKLLQELEAKQKGPISAGEVQVKTQVQNFIEQGGKR